jgi:oxygen-dependent protoporphyrinogen oxidase
MDGKRLIVGLSMAAVLAAAAALLAEPAWAQGAAAPVPTRADYPMIGGMGGRGVSGLATAYALQRQGHRVAVLERQVRPGGNAISERIGGFLMEQGPSSVNAAGAEVESLSRSLGLDGARCELGPGVRHRYLLRDHSLHQIQAHPLGFATSSYLPLRARLRMMGEFLVPPKRGGQEETVTGFWARRFGKDFAGLVIDPLVGGLFAGLADDLSMPAIFPTLVDMERRHGSISRGVIASRRAGGSMPGKRLYSWRDGMGTLPRALAAALGDAVSVGVPVRRIRRLPDGFRIETGAGALAARGVVLATQPHVAAELLDGLDPAGAEAAASVDAPPLAVVFLGYRRQQVEHPLDGLGYLVPSREGRPVTGTLFCSTMFPGRAPEGHVALAAYLGGARAPVLAQAPAEELIAVTRAELWDLLGARGEPVIARVRQWPRGLPQYRLGHGERMATLRGAEQRAPGLFLTGNYFAGLSVTCCMAQACETAARAHNFLTERAAGTRGGRTGPDFPATVGTASVTG